MAVAKATATAAYSTNGTTWSTATLPASASWESAAYGNGIFVAVSTGTATAAYLAAGLAVTDTTTITLTSTLASQLVVTTQPSASANSGTALATQPVVAVENSAGTVITGATGTVTASVATGNGVVSQGATATLSSGVATFSGLTVSGASGPYTLQFSSTPSVATTLPVSANWQTVAYGNGTFVTVGNSSTNTAYSTNSATWSAGGALPTSCRLATGRLRQRHLRDRGQLQYQHGRFHQRHHLERGGCHAEHRRLGLGRLRQRHLRGRGLRQHRRRLFHQRHHLERGHPAQ